MSYLRRKPKHKILIQKTESLTTNLSAEQIVYESPTLKEKGKSFSVDCDN